MRKSIPLFLVIAILFAGIGIYFGLHRSETAKSDVSAVNQLFMQSLPDAQGQLQPLSQWKGKNLLVNFWATWCAPCVQEMPELSALQSEVMSKNIQIIGIGIDSAGNIAEFSARYKIAYPLYVAGMTGTELGRQLGNQGGGLPFTVLVGQNGQIRKTYLGRLKLPELRKDLNAL